MPTFNAKEKLLNGRFVSQKQIKQEQPDKLLKNFF
jgi:hypothetical protein